MLMDADIRAKLIEKIKKDNQNNHYRIIEELCICDGLARADIALANGILHGYEIKSDCDTLERLSNQIECYNNTFDKVTIVVGKKFENNIIDEIPKHWGVEVAYVNRFQNITIKRVRAPKLNKDVLSTNLLDLLWNAEIKSFLKENKVKGYSNKDKSSLKDLVITSIPFKVLRDYTRETLKARTGWREDLQ